MDWWRKALFQFEGYPIVQKYYAEMFLYLFEKEVQRIAISNLPFRQRKKSINDLLKCDSLIQCINISPGILPKDTRLFTLYKMSGLIVLKYSNRNS